MVRHHARDFPFRSRGDGRDIHDRLIDFFLGCRKDSSPITWLTVNRKESVTESPR
jgi:hypothetical protein